MGIFEDLNSRLRANTVAMFQKKLYLICLSYILLFVLFMAVILKFEISNRLFYISGALLTLLLLAYSIISIFLKNIRPLLEIRVMLNKLMNAIDFYHPCLSGSLHNLRDRDFSVNLDVPNVLETDMEEYRQLLDLLKRGMDSIKTSNQQNQRISFDLVRSIQKLVDTSNVQASGSSEQASSVAEITATMEELARTAAQIAENSNKVAKQAEDSDHASKEGFDLVNNVIQAIQTIDSKMSQISQKTQVLGSQSKQIQKVLDIIYEIANETHLLALNATIESVAAGEFGKRFGVVAAEVRRLAESARENAESTRTIIEEFQNSINTTILSIDEGNKLTSSVNSTAKEIIMHLTHIKETVGQTSQNASEISIATQQQRSASDQIVLTLKDVTEVTKIQAQELKKSSGELEKLNSLALNLQLLTQQVTLDSPLSLGFKVRTIAEMSEVYTMDKRLHAQVLHEVLENNIYIEFIYIADKNGKLFSWGVGKDREIPSQDIIRVGNDCTGRPWYNNAINTRVPFISEVYKSLLSGEDCFSVSVGIFDDEAQPSGVLSIDINSKEWNKMIM